jgi:hypothetical protein
VGARRAAQHGRFGSSRVSDFLPDRTDVDAELPGRC